MYINMTPEILTSLPHGFSVNDNHQETLFYDGFAECTVLAYDRQNRLSGQLDSYGYWETITRNENGDITSIVDSNGAFAVYRYDEQNNMTLFQRFDGTNLVTTYKEYDEYNRLVYENSNGIEYWYERDFVGLMTKMQKQMRRVIPPVNTLTPLQTFVNISQNPKWQLMVSDDPISIRIGLDRFTSVEDAINWLSQHNHERNLYFVELLTEHYRC